MTVTAVRFASPKQVAFLTSLAVRKGKTLTDVASLSSRAASATIDWLLSLPNDAAAPTETPNGPTEPGMYFNGTSIFKVQRAKQSGGLYALTLVPIHGTRLSETDERVKWEFRYVAGAIKSLKASDKLSLEDAKKFGIRFGVCCICGAFLKDADSVAAGIGPVCAKKGWGF